MDRHSAAAAILDRLRTLGSEHNRQGMARFGINVERACGVSMAVLRPLAREHRRDHALAIALWDTQAHEARILACMVEDPRQAGPEQLGRWVEDLDSWDVTDQFCNKLVVKTPYAWELAVAWAAREAEFVRRAGFSLMAQLAVHDKAAPDAAFLPFLEFVVAYATDGRNFVKKAVNWALRQIGKRNAVLRGRAVATARRLLELDSKTARWVARDALRELEGT
ncbi:DNA alkylation repair protein [Fundidesulfovibrio terrae]|uniref:DNA alkylation repair protein n=1 Tax=Fundidesulfovibrio terrae TaxID=2922866 RepID=UPI001FAF7B59|nr:DNA alkylation repair protein [Fundidesulfovibrio terrae]